MSNDVRRIIKELSAEIRRRGTAITPTLKREIAACASDQAMVERARAVLDEGGSIAIDDYMRLRTAAEESAVRLLGESARPGPSKIEIELVPAPSQFTQLKDECAALRLRVAELESGQAGSGPSEVPALTPEPENPASPAPSNAQSKDSANPLINNVVPIETREAKIARLRRENGDAPQSLRSAFSQEGISYRDGGGRFDFPSHWR